MPFEIINIPPSSSPFLKVRCCGLLLLYADKTSVEIGILRDAPPHDLQIALKAIKPDQSTVAIPILTGHLQNKNFSVTVDTPAKPGVWAYQTKDPFFRDKKKDDGRDFRWKIDLEGDDFHRDVLSAKSAKIRPYVKMDNGVFYTAETTDEYAVAITRFRGNNGSRYGMSSIAAVIGASIDLATGGSVLLEWQKNGKDKSLKLPRAEDGKGATYELSISNEPPAGSPSDPDELANYYTVLTKKDGKPIPDEETWHLTFEVRTALFGTDEIPCMPTVLGGGK
jgi:hypothetical protein